METNVDKLQQAWLDQLYAEIKLSEWGSVRRFSAALGMNYYTFRRYTSGEREIPFWVLTNSLALLGVSISDFEKSVQTRLERESTVR